MEPHSTDFTAARTFMVDGQIRPNRVNDPRILQAMRTLPREQFVPPHLRAMAYIDEDLPIGQGRVLVEPLVTARLVQMARVQPGDRALVVGAGTGYGAAVTAACGASVTALEEDDALMTIALAVLPRLAPAIRMVGGRLADGLPADGPWDVIIIEGAVTRIPDAYATQLKPGGRLVTVVNDNSAGVGRGVLAEPVQSASGVHLRSKEMFDCNTPLLPGLRTAPVFVF